MATAKKVSVRQEVQAVGFYLGDDEYAIYINKVREIVPMTDIRKIPKSPQFVEGVINIRGKIIPVLDLRKRFDLSITETNRQSCKILIVDNVSEVMKFYADDIEKAPPMFSANISSQYIQGVAKIENKLIILLDIERLLSFEEKSVLERIG